MGWGSGSVFFIDVEGPSNRPLGLSLSSPTPAPRGHYLRQKTGVAASDPTLGPEDPVVPDRPEGVASKGTSKSGALRAALREGKSLSPRPAPAASARPCARACVRARVCEGLGSLLRFPWFFTFTRWRSLSLSVRVCRAFDCATVARPEGPARAHASVAQGVRPAREPPVAPPGR